MAVEADIGERTLAELAEGEIARVVAIQTADPDLATKLREIGFSEGDEVELITYGPFGRQPIAVRLNRTIVAMRTAEASAIRVQARD